jgi:lipid-A-disaccharide synthase
MKYYIIAGEASGDLHAANLMNALKQADPDARFRVWGGDRMRSAGGELVKHIRDLAFMGFAEVVMNLPAILRNFRLCERDLIASRPDVLVLIDYPGFNMRMAAFARKNNIPVVYYISPQVWAWKQSRVKKIRRDVNRMLVILPFEKEFYARFGMDVSFVGHPLLDVAEIFGSREENSDFRERNRLPAKPLVAVLPGSREQEVTRLLDGMVAASRHFPDHHFVIAGLSLLPEKIYSTALLPDNVSLLFDQTYAILAHAEAALVASGTATLETALFDVPLVVCYKANPFSYWIARRLVRIKYISLVNLIVDKPLVPELIQHEYNPESLKAELGGLLRDPSRRQEMLAGYRELKTLLGGEGASKRAAAEILDLLKRQIG